MNIVDQECDTDQALRPARTRARALPSKSARVLEASGIQPGEVVLLWGLSLCVTAVLGIVAGVGL